MLIAAAPAAGSTGTGRTSTGVTAKVFHGLEITSVADLKFGTIAPYPKGSAFIKAPDTLPASITTGNAILLPGSVYQPAVFTIVAEGLQRFTIDITDPVNLVSTTDPSQIISVNIQGSATSSHTMDGTAGSPVTYPLIVGGSFTLPSTQAPGVYKGSIVLTIAYP